MRSASFAIMAVMLAVLPAQGSAAVVLPKKNIPIPTPRPAIENAPAPQPLAYAPTEFENAATEALDSLATRMNETIATVGDVSALKEGLDELSSGDSAGALAVRDRLPAHSLDHEILSWAIALGGGLSSHDIIAAERELAEWPGADALRRNAERALYREGAPASEVLAALGDRQPQTMEGVIALARAELASDRREAAHATISAFWRKAKLEAKEEAAIQKEFGSLLTRADHRFRMERMLYCDRVNAALRVADEAGARKLAEAWGSAIRDRRNAGELLEAVPAAQRSAGYFFIKAKYLRGKEKYEAAAKVVLAAPRDAEAIVDPNAWWIERRVLSRELLDIGKVEAAYEVAAGHAAESPVQAADAEFHAGWYALRGLHKPAVAARHFRRIAEIADGPISLSRAWYWLGRAAEAGGPGDAGAYYEQAARYGTAFYGQLAAAKLGRAAIPAEYPSPTNEDRQSFAAREAVQAIDRLEAAGYVSRADILYRDLAGELTSPGELALLAAKAEKRGDHHLALRVGKIAASHGLDIGALAHPMGAIPPSARIPSAGKALAYAIARQESEFNAAAVSSAGARGLLQLLPGTAKEMAKEVGLGYSRQRLTTDPGYNAALGAAYLREQLDRFEGSYVLTFAGYNAGPGRAREWVKRYGDPRGKDIDEVVDWIERIPYTETRNYVQRVMENLQVYKMRLSGRVDVAGDLSKGG